MFLALRFVWILNDCLFAINFELFQLVTQHALNWFTLERIGHFVYGFGDGVVLQMDGKEMKFRGQREMEN